MYRCGCTIAVLYPWYYTIVLYITMYCALYYTTPFELWTLFEDRYYGAMTGCLFALHKNPTGASGGERNHKAAKRVHSGSQARSGNHKTGTAIFYLNLLYDQIATTRAPKFCKCGLESGYEGELEEDLLI